MMRDKPKEPFTPRETHDTVRQAILAELRKGMFSARDLSAAVGIPEREVYHHLEHIHRSIASSARRLVIMPAECKKCGFVFAKREKLNRPGKCPVCKGESIRGPRFGIGDAL
ncbi:MAG TPA: transcriptional regulator [Nitrospirota bacterium]|nr:transcriptional regulator [Nitrospirota bacterium]